MALGDLIKGPDPVEEDERIMADLTAFLERPQPVTRLDRYHASEIRDMCPRMAYWTRSFANDFGAVWKTATDARMRVTFDIGKAMHEWVQGRYLPNLDGYFNAPEFKELSLTIAFCDGVEMGASVDDFLVNRETGEIIGAEIKTISLKAFEKMRIAKIDHRFQTHMYRWGLREGAYWKGPDVVAREHTDKTFKDVNRFAIIYVVKQYPPDGVPPIKVFMIDPEGNEKHGAEYDKAVSAAKAKLNSIKEAVQVGDQVVSMGSCETKHDTKALWCFFRSVCFPDDPGLNVMGRLDELRRKWQGHTIENRGPECPFLAWT